MPDGGPPSPGGGVPALRLPAPAGPPLGSRAGLPASPRQPHRRPALGCLSLKGGNTQHGLRWGR